MWQNGKYFEIQYVCFELLNLRRYIFLNTAKIDGKKRLYVVPSEGMTTLPVTKHPDYCKQHENTDNPCYNYGD